MSTETDNDGNYSFNARELYRCPNISCIGYKGCPHGREAHHRTRLCLVECPLGLCKCVEVEPSTHHD